ncbi:crotonobetaine/carnitine-CoA ligase [Amycolatopsis sacchari]|uniref:Crotonobetaine/carnitine-CoA ligase n=1 Tax=Amycolatopsis sacchari TaxID=115433 RepID=A0A1I3WN52_9PSEU|nr:AMP-binding protein [Amycolatopsis sacchari]SFK07886.1 crotonobetaine/carnitine-CoA ligase [Amycolatopsis sacchari]
MTTETTAALVAAAPPDAVFSIVDGGAPVTYGEQHRRLRATAARLASLGVRPGDRVHVSLPNCQEFLDVWFATAHLGAILLPTNPRSAADEYAHVLTDAEPRVSIADGEAASVLEALGHHVVQPAALAGDGDVPAADVSPTDPAAILYTSGTTSRPKGVVITHANYLAVGRAVADHLSVTAADRWFVALPLFHANAQYYCTMSALVRGASVAVAPRFSASRWGIQAARLGATLGSLFAAPIRMILANPPADGEAVLRTVLFAQNLSARQATEFERRFATRLVQLYGMTETVLPPTMNPDSADRRWDSIGRPLPGVEVLLTGEDGQPVPDGQTGEIRVRGVPGETIAAGYWRNPEATAATFGDGLLHTGDLARRDADGFLYFVDRAKDMIKRSGENISAGEVERVAGEHPAVAECAAVGVPDPVHDEAVLLVVVPAPGTNPGAEEILAWCRERLAAFKVPSRVHFLPALPRTSVGKIRKTELRTLVP